MAIDHVGRFLLANASWMRAIGRFAFPLFALVLAWRVSDMLWRNPLRDFRPMLARLLASGIAAEILFRLMTRPSILNVMFSFMLALLLILLSLPDEGTSSLLDLGRLGRLVLALVLFLVAGRYVDYKWAGVAMICCLFVYFHHRSGLALLGALIALGVLTFDHPAHLAWASAPVAALLVWVKAPWLRVKRPIRYLFYWVYPAHLLLIWICFALGLRMASSPWIQFKPQPKRPAAVWQSPQPATPNEAPTRSPPAVAPGR